MRATALLMFALVVATAAAFAYFDRDSHSVSDSVRPLLAMLPLWALGLVLARSLLRRR